MFDIQYIMWPDISSIEILLANQDVCHQVNHSFGFWRGTDGVCFQVKLPLDTYAKQCYFYSRIFLQFCTTSHYILRLSIKSYKYALT
jgi:hypothetical protein